MSSSSLLDCVSKVFCGKGNYRDVRIELVAMVVGREEGEGKGGGVSGTLRVVQRGSREITTVHSTHVFI